MDLGISGKKALVCGASAGLGLACATALATEGAQVVIVARTEGPLREAAAGLAELAAPSGGQVAWVAADVTTAEGRARIFAAHPQFDIVVTNAGGPPALVTTMSKSRPASKMRSRPAAVVTSAASACTRPPSGPAKARNCSAAACTVDSVRATIITSTPSCASACAQA